MTAGCHQHRTPAGGRSRFFSPYTSLSIGDRGEQGVGETASTDEALEYDPKHLRPNFTDRMDTSISRLLGGLIGRRVDLVGQGIGTIADTFGTVRCPGPHGVF